MSRRTHPFIKSVSSSDHKTTLIKGAVTRSLAPEQWDHVIGALRVAQSYRGLGSAPGDAAIWEHIRNELIAQEPPR